MFSLVNSSLKKAPPNIKCKWNRAGFAKFVPDFEICAQSLNYFDTIPYYFTSEQNFKEFSLFSSTFTKNSSFQGLFKRP